MMTFQVNPSRPSKAKVLISQGSSNCSQRGPAVTEYPGYRNLRMGADGGPAAFRQNRLVRKQFPAIQPLHKSRDWKDLVSDFIVGGSPYLATDVKLEFENSDPKEDLCGRQFLFDKRCTRLERTRTEIPPLTRDYHVHRPGNLHPFGVSKELSHSHVQRPFTLGCPERYELNATPEILFPTTLVLNGRNTFSVGNCKISRPKVNYPTYTLQTVRENQKNQPFPDPMIGAPRSFIHRVTELSSLEGETVRQEKLRKMKKHRKPPS
ncbi:uncharacterized protein si:ch211-171b20.3 isoform X2 [Notolabrus celidotus]|uniref:uncharacterized protein si:ch211-171b20.3 isoform X2 n=1 Tax=Notolabrus celidotus TaxID=1203425 RepID=UPI00148F7FD9|nr:uncharacterized protein si:ch211-171b20.3 isoform X2 [Notolabrus celidotus]